MKIPAGRRTGVGARDIEVEALLFRQELVAALVLVPLALVLDVTAIERLVLVLSILHVLAIELLNSAIEATVENLAQELITRIAPKMPDNIRAVGVYVYEGLNKGTHLLAEVHRREGEKRRRTR